MATRRLGTPKPAKAHAVGRAEVIGLRPAAREAGIAVSTLQSWRTSPAFAQLRAEKSEEVAADVWAGFQTGVRRMVDLMATTEDLSKVAIATGILYDKHALMTGSATSRSEHRDISIDDEGVAAIEGLLAGSPWSLPAGVERGSNGTGTNGKH